MFKDIRAAGPKRLEVLPEDGQILLRRPIVQNHRQQMDIEALRQVVFKKVLRPGLNPVGEIRCGDLFACNLQGRGQVAYGAAKVGKLASRFDAVSAGPAFDIE